ncbi:MAG: hypothetical protein U5M51_02465 [Emticicia sp.]|nr:hypothetical protein [Emticicia sp.]
MFIAFLKSWKEHSPLSMLKDLVETAYKLNLPLLYEAGNNHFLDGEVRHFRVIISFHRLDDMDENFIIDVEGVDKELIELGADKEYDWIAPNINLVSLSYIDNLQTIKGHGTSFSEDNHKLIHVFSQFAYEYLKLNPNTYLWTEGNRYWGLKDFEILSQNYDQNWLDKGHKK